MIAGVCVLRADSSCSLLVSQFRSPVTKLGKNEILLQNRSGKGMPYIMAILDDVVTAVTSIIIPQDTPPEGV
jgi:DNA gyrase subunit A